jgi:hypothetical protein
MSSGISASVVARAGLRRRLRRLGSALGDIGAILAFTYAIPLVILTVGIPIALVVRLAMWIARVR